MTEVKCLLGSNETEVEGKVEDWLGAQMTYSGVLSGLNHATGRLIVNVSSREIEDELIESDLCIFTRGDFMAPVDGCHCITHYPLLV
jgi:hypothetical protein